MNNFDSSILIGKELGEAKLIIKEHGLMFRIFKKNGKQFPSSEPFKGNRLNIHINNNIITEVFGIF